MTRADHVAYQLVAMMTIATEKSSPTAALSSLRRQLRQDSCDGCDEEVVGRLLENTDEQWVHKKIESSDTILKIKKKKNKINSLMYIVHIGVMFV